MTKSSSITEVFKQAIKNTESTQTLTQQEVFDSIKSFADEIKEHESACGCIPKFFEKYPQVDFDQLQQQAELSGFHIKRACDISESKYFYEKEWNKHKSVIIFFGDETNL